MDAVSNNVQRLSNNDLCYSAFVHPRKTPRNTLSGPRWRSRAAPDRSHFKVLRSHNDVKDVSRQGTSISFCTLVYVLICLDKGMMVVLEEDLDRQSGR